MGSDLGNKGPSLLTATGGQKYIAHSEAESFIMQIAKIFSFDLHKDCTVKKEAQPEVYHDYTSCTWTEGTGKKLLSNKTK